MEIGEIIKNSFKYPLNNLKEVLIFFVLTLAVTFITGLGTACTQSVNWVVGLIIGIIALIIAFVIPGYQLDIIRFAIDKSDDAPGIEFKKNFIDGVKLIIVEIVYLIIPAIIVAIIGGVSGLYSSLFEIFSVASQNLTNASAVANTTTFAQTIPEDVVATFWSSLTITAIVACVLFVIFSFALMMAQARLAKTGQLGYSLNFIEAIKDISRVGVLKVIAVVILIIIIVGIIYFIVGLILQAIPVLGIIIGIILSPYLTFVDARACGLLYSDI